MHLFMKIQLFLILLVLPGTSNAALDDESSGKASVSIVFSVYPIGQPDVDDIWYEETPGNHRALRFRPFSRSRNYSYRGPRKIAFCSRKTDSDGNPVYTPITFCELPENGQRFLFIFSFEEHPDSQGKQVNVVVSNDAPDGLPFDSISFLNATPWLLEGLFDGKPVVFRPGLSQPVSIHPDPDKPLSIGLGVRVNGKMEPVLMNHWSFHSGNRILMLLLPPKETGSKRLRAISLIQHKHEFQPPEIETDDASVKKESTPSSVLPSDPESNHRM